MSVIRTFRDLIAWQKGMDLTVAIYELTKHYPTDERYGLVSQMRRAASSIPCNVAEGFGRRTKADYLRFLDIAAGSANELITQLMLSDRLNMVSKTGLDKPIQLCEEVRRIIRGLIIAIDHNAKTSRCDKSQGPPAE